MAGGRDHRQANAAQGQHLAVGQINIGLYTERGGIGGMEAHERPGALTHLVKGHPVVGVGVGKQDGPDRGAGYDGQDALRLGGGVCDEALLAAGQM